ncbi:MAG: DEAD/DEAH box helicase [Propionibacteriaceae bacterium]|nr:DEAD/DEAH box helicase [Propionibacteriaceae bacterium]
MTLPKKRKQPKSFKADGTPKKRWTAEQRAARGHGPRKRGGRNQEWTKEQRGPAVEAAAERSERPTRSFDRDQWRDRFEPGERFGRTAREDRPSRDDRPRGRDRFERGERPRWDRDDRADRGGRWEDRPASRAWGRDDRPARPGRFERRTDRQIEGRWSREDGQGRSERWSRDDRPAWGRDERPRGSAWGRDDRPSRGERWGERPSSRRWDRDERPRGSAWGRDDERGGDRGRGRRFDDRPHGERRPNRFEDHPRRHDRARERQLSEAPAEADTMSWTQVEAVELDLGTAETSGFVGLGVPAELAAALTAQGITDPFPIQTATIPDALAGRDVLGRGRTGSGKTLAFGLPLLARLAEAEPAGGAPRALILTPTRELALQIADNLSPLARALRLDLTLIAGGMSYGPQLRAFERGVDVIVATPGRLIDLLEQGAVDLSQVLVTVLDEADHMADLGFMPAVTTLLDLVPAEGQRLLYSATLDDAVGELVRRYLTDPVTHEVDSSKASVTTMVHRVLHVLPHHKNALTAEIANREGRTVVFVRTQLAADRVAGQLREAGVMAGALHGGLTQGARARILAAFKEGQVPVLVATDVAARGIHVDDVSLVLQVDPPRDHKDYLHRAGRTARAGESGVVASIVLPHQRKMMRRITGQAGVKGAPLEVTPGSVELREATGARPASGLPIDEADYLALIAPKQRPRKPRPEGRGFGRGRGFGGRRYGERKFRDR